MKKDIRSRLFDPQIANADTAKREQVVLMLAVLVLAIVAFALHVYGQGA